MTWWGLAIAAIFESAGALIAGGDVTRNHQKRHHSPAGIGDSTPYLADARCLLAGALAQWATWLGAPVFHAFHRWGSSWGWHSGRRPAVANWSKMGGNCGELLDHFPAAGEPSWPSLFFIKE